MAEQTGEISELTDQEADELMEALKQNDDDYTFLKAAEECAELTEILIKKVTKKGHAKEPSNERLIEEIGDVIFRVGFLASLIDPTGDLLTARLESKARMLHTRRDQFKGRL